MTSTCRDAPFGALMTEMWGRLWDEEKSISKNAARMQVSTKYMITRTAVPLELLAERMLDLVANIALIGKKEISLRHGRTKRHKTKKYPRQLQGWSAPLVE